jgi:hypothetical protein
MAGRDIRRLRSNILTGYVLIVLVLCIQFYSLGRFGGKTFLVHDDDPTISETETSNWQKTPSTEPTTSNKLRIAHVVNLYKLDGVDSKVRSGNGTAQKERSIFYPLDQAQNVTIATMLRAKEATHTSNIHVNLIAAIYKEDLGIVPHGFDSILLNRSTAKEYPVLAPPRKLPFLAEIFGLTYQSTSEFDFLVYTNTDIALHFDFYKIVAEKIDLGYDAFSINRRAIPENTKDGRPFTSNDLDTMYDMIPNGDTHPGYDCFIFDRNILPKIEVGDMFLGFPPWGRALHFIAEHDQYSWASNYTNFQSDDLNATFHLGQQGSWSYKGKKFIINSAMRTFLRYCKPLAWRLGTTSNGMRTMEQYRLKNSLNCALIFARWEHLNLTMPLIPGENVNRIG